MTVRFGVVLRSVIDRVRRSPRRVATALARAYSPSSLLFSSVIVLGMLLLVSALIASQYFGKDPVTSLTFFPNDGWCRTDLHESLGVHCFGDYSLVKDFASQPNPWNEYLGVNINYPAAGILPHAFFGAIGTHLGAPNVGLVGYLLTLIAALLVPAIWASRGKPTSMRLIVAGLFGLLSVPAIMALDRGNSVALALPPLLAFLVSLRRGNYRVTVVAIVLAVLVRPQYVLLVVALLALRKWRHAAVAIAGVVVTNVLAFLVWPRNFPGEILQSVQNVFRYGSAVSMEDRYPTNVSFAKGLYQVESFVKSLFGISGDGSWVDDHVALLGSVIVLIICGIVVAVGKRLPAHLAGILLIMCASLFSSTSWSYYLVFALPVAAILLRDPLGAPPRDRWNGVLDGAGASIGKVTASILVVLATAASVSRILLPKVIAVPRSAGGDILATTGELVPILWLAAAATVLVAWCRPIRRPTAGAAG